MVIIKGETLFANVHKMPKNKRTSFETKLKQVNGRLKANNVRARIAQKGRKLYLVATLPPRPDSKRLGPHQQYLALEIQANSDGLKIAEAQAKKVGALLDCKEFQWESNYVKPKPSIVTGGCLIERMQAHYFEIRATTPKSLQTWKDEYWRVFNQLPLNEPISLEALENLVLSTKPDTRSRRRYAIALSALARFAGLPDTSLKALKGVYSPKTIPLRNLPSDRQIADAYSSLNNHPDWQWVFGAIATYGLRPHEAFHLSLEDFPIARVLEGKTGTRQVWPIFPEWAEQWNLKEMKLPNCSGTNTDLGNRIAHAFKRYKISFKPYDLRHCWAIRSVQFGCNISLAAKEMGHSVEVHTSIYHAALSENVHNEAFKKLLNNPNRPQPPL